MVASTTILLEARDLPKSQLSALGRKAKAAGRSLPEYVRLLIAVDVLADKPFKEILAPVRKGFASVSDGELSSLVKTARRAYHTTKRRGC